MEVKVAASKNRARWPDLSGPARQQVENLVGASVTRADNCPGGFLPGFASRLSLADGRRVFVKAIDADAWPGEAITYRAEAGIAAALPTGVSAPRFLGLSDGPWVVLAFEDIDGREPDQPWNLADLRRVVGALAELSTFSATPGWPTDLPRLGGWRELADDPSGPALLAGRSRWAADHLTELIRWESDGLVAAQGSSIVHCDVYPHNVLLTADQVFFVDWPHARRAAPIVDLVTVLSSAAADGLDPEPIASDLADRFTPDSVDAVLAAHAGFCLAGGVFPAPPGLQPIVETKLRLGLATVDWLRRRRAGLRATGEVQPIG
jgi:hypothetical protein